MVLNFLALGGKQYKYKFPSAMVLGDADSTGDGKTLSTGVRVVVWKKKVGAQQMMTFGKGAIRGGVDDRGILYLSLKDNASAPVQLEGTFRFELWDANDIPQAILHEVRSEEVRGSKTDRTQAYFLEELSHKGVAKEDSYLVITFKPDASANGKTIKDDNSDFQIPVTTFYL